MNPGQEMFYNFFIERAIDEKKEEAKTLLEDCFKKPSRMVWSGFLLYKNSQM